MWESLAAHSIFFLFLFFGSLVLWFLLWVVLERVFYKEVLCDIVKYLKVHYYYSDRMVTADQIKQLKKRRSGENIVVSKRNVTLIGKNAMARLAALKARVKRKQKHQSSARSVPKSPQFSSSTFSTKLTPKQHEVAHELTLKERIFGMRKEKIPQNLVRQHGVLDLSKKKPKHAKE